MTFRKRSIFLIGYKTNHTTAKMAIKYYTNYILTHGVNND